MLTAAGGTRVCSEDRDLCLFSTLLWGQEEEAGLGRGSFAWSRLPKIIHGPVSLKSIFKVAIGDRNSSLLAQLATI